MRDNIPLPLHCQNIVQDILRLLLLTLPEGLENLIREAVALIRK
jgi:hypothetical protein